jgi:bacteriocin-like protein
MTDAEKAENIENIKVIIEEIKELSKELSDEDLKAVAGGWKPHKRRDFP